MPTAEHHVTTSSLGATDRRDTWWTEPVISAAVLIGFIIYATIAAFANAHYEWGPYLSPFYSPLFKPNWLPSWLTPAIFILWIPGGFRATCYYYRKTYYRAFFFDPMGCAVGEGSGKGYKGERAFPFVFQNLHRYFLYLSIIVVAVLWVDAFKAFMWTGANGTHFGMGVGTLVLLLNAVLLSGYTFGCHSFRHLIGGKIDHYSCTQLGEERHGAWKAVSVLNKNHQSFAWASLFSVGFADLYVRLVSMGIWHDLRFF
jgi:hypothetical protein